MMAHPSNPDYGHGAFRRRIRLYNEPGQVGAELEDCNHGFRLIIKHQHQYINAIEVEALRYPLSSCPGAIKPLQALVGCRLDSSLNTFKQASQPRNNCTHLYDLALLAINHAQRNELERIYDVEVPDSMDTKQSMSVLRNGQQIHHWEIDRQLIVKPNGLVDKPVMQGFSKWSQQHFNDADNLEAALVLQRGYFVARARRVELNNRGGEPAVNDTMMTGACYSYSPNVVERSWRLPGTVRDFSDCPEQLLTFQ